MWLAEGKYISTYTVCWFRDLRMFIQRNCYLFIFFQRFIPDILSPGDELFHITFSKVVIIINYLLSNFKQLIFNFVKILYVKIIYYKNERVK